MVTQKPKLIRLTTSSKTLNGLLKGQLRFFNEYFEVIGLSSDDELLKRVSQNEGIRTIGINIKREIGLFSDFGCLLKLIRVFLKEKPLIIHANSPKISLLSMFAGWLTQVPNRVYTVTGLRFETTNGFLRVLLTNAERLTCFFATKVIPEGNGVKQTLLKWGITRKPLDVILNGNINGIDLKYFDKEQVRGSSIDLKKIVRLGEGNFVYIFIGRIVRDKGIEELIQSFDIVFQKHPNCQLIIVGPFEKESDPIPKAVKDIILNHPGIIYAGLHEDIRPFLAISDVFILPSYREGFPNVVMQAGAFGLPCIVTDVSGSNEIIIPNENGLIVPVKNIQALSEAMILLFENDVFRKTLSSNSRRLISSRFDQKDVLLALLKEYQSMVPNESKHMNN